MCSLKHLMHLGKEEIETNSSETELSLDYELSRQTLITTRLNNQHHFHMEKLEKPDLIVITTCCSCRRMKNYSRIINKRLHVSSWCVHKMEINKVIAKFE